MLNNKRKCVIHEITSIITSLNQIPTKFPGPLFFTDELFEKRATEFCGYLIKRGYNPEFARREIDRARRVPRGDTLRDKQSVTNQPIPFVATIHPALPNIAKILHRLQLVLQSSRRCQGSHRAGTHGGFPQA